jgi:hypothetical protein
MSHVLRVKWSETPEDGVRIAGAMTAWNRAHWPSKRGATDEKASVVYAQDPDLVKQAKARAALAKMVKGATVEVEADGTEVYTWAK